MAKRVNKRFLVVLTTVVLVGGVTGMAAMYIIPKVFKKNPQQLIAESQRMEKEGNIGEAINLYRQAAAADSGNPLTTVALGDLYDRHATVDPDNIGKARQAWQSALSIDPSCKPALESLLDLHWGYMQMIARPELFTAVRETASRLLELDKSDRKAAMRLNIVTIRQAQTNVMTKPEEIQKSIKALRELAHLDKTDAEAPNWAIQGEMYLAAQTAKRVSDRDEAREMVEKIGQSIEAMLEGQETNASIQFRAAQLLSMLNPLETYVEQIAGAGADATSRPSATTRPVADGPTTMPATTMPTDVKRTGGRYGPRITELLAAARKHVKASNPDYVDIQLTAADWARGQGKSDEARKIIEDLAAARPDHSAVRFAYSRSFRGDPAKRETVIELLGKPLPVEGLSGIEALQRKEQQIGLQIELANVRLMNAEAERDETKKRQIVDRVQADAKQLEAVTGAQSVGMMELKGKLKLIQRKIPDAIVLLQQAVDRSGDRPNYETMYALATAYLAAEQTGQAEKLLNQILTRIPEFTPAYPLRIQALVAEGRMVEARSVLDEFKKRAPDAKELPAITAAIEGGKTRTAYVEKLPENSPQERIRKAELLRSEGKTDEAIAIAEAAFEADPKYLPAIDSLVGLYVSGNRRDDALALVRRAVEANPENNQIKLLLDSLAKRTPEEVQKWRLEQIAKEADPATRELKYVDFYLQLNAAALQRNDQADAKRQAAEAEKHLVSAEKLKSADDASLLAKRFDFLLRMRRLDEASAVQQRLASMNFDEVNGQLVKFRLALTKAQVATTSQAQSAAFAEAEAAARDITRQRPQFALGWQFLGTASQAQGKFREAIDAFTTALERQGRNYEALRGLIQTHISLNEPDEAKTLLDRARQLFPSDVVLREMALEHELNFGDPSKVVVERERLYKENPEQPGNALALADSYLQSISDADEKKSAPIVAKTREVLEDGMKKWPEDTRFQVRLAKVMLGQGDFLGGEKLLKEYASRNKLTDTADGDLLLADFYARARKPGLTEQSLRDAVKKSNGAPEIKQRLAEHLTATNRPMDGVKELEGVPGAGPAIQRVRMLLAAGAKEEAYKAVNDAAAANSNSRELANLHAQMLIEALRLDDAEKLVRERLTKNNSDDAARYYSAMIKLNRKPANPNEAAKELIVVTERNPRALDAQVLLSDAYQAMGDTGTAIVTLDRAVQLAPGRSDIRIKLIDWCMSAGRFDAVIKLASEGAANPRFSADPVWSRAMAQAYSATGRFADAEKQINNSISLASKEQVPELERQYLAVLYQAKKFPTIAKLTGDWLGKGRKEWWLYIYRGLAKAGINDKTALQDLDAALATVDPEKDFSLCRDVIKTIHTVGGLGEALKRIAKYEDKYSQWRLLAGELCFDASDTPAALQHLEPLLKDVDKLPLDQKALLYISLGRSYHQLKPKPDLVKAADAYKKYLELQPQDFLALNNLAYLLSEEISPPRLADAKVYSQKVYDIARDWKPSEAKGRILDTHGWILVLNQGKDIDEGIRLLEEVVSDFPILEARYHLGEAQLQKKRGEEAQVQLEAALEMIVKAKKDKSPYDESLEPRIQQALERAKTMNSAAKAR